MMEKAVIISTGDELTSGRVVDTNSTMIADKLNEIGMETVAVLKVGDHRERLFWALNQAKELGDVIIGTGGLGPTTDDLTTEIVAQFLNRRLVQDSAVADGLKRRFAARGFPWTENNLKQALFPAGSAIVPNPAGTACGFRIEVAPGQTLFWLSGVPQEMTAMLKDSVIPWLIQERKEASTIASCTFKIFGLTESKLDDLLKPVLLGDQARLSFRAHFPDLTLRLSVRGEEQRTAIFEQLRNQIRILLGSAIYSEEDRTLEEIVGQRLLERRQTLALAESCTGGYISHRVTRIAGSSAYYYGGVVTYSNEAKISHLGVTANTLEKHGAVSRETALQMSRGIRERTGASIGLSITGVAGPTGGSGEKPVGTVWISICQNHLHEAQQFRFHGDRERIILGASQAALNWLRLVLQDQQGVVEDSL